MGKVPNPGTNIPKSYTLAGNQWTVHFKSKKDLKSNYGRCDESTNEIWIYKRLGHAKRMQTFIHEAAHAVLFTLGYLEHDEQLVESISQLVYQQLITGEYDDREEMGSAKQRSKRDTRSTTGTCCGLHSDDDCRHKSDRGGER